MIDIPAINAQIFSRAATDTAGLGLRALLGAASASVIAAHTLNAEWLPVAPFLAWRRFPVAGESGEMRLVVGLWYIYDEPKQGYWRINQIANALQTLYTDYAIPYGKLTTSIGGEQDDATLGGLLWTAIRVSYNRRA